MTSEMAIYKKGDRRVQFLGGSLKQTDDGHRLFVDAIDLETNQQFSEPFVDFMANWRRVGSNTPNLMDELSEAELGLP